jgi:gamma-glutamyltranspeptidase
MSEVKITTRESFGRTIAEVLDAGGLAVSQTITAESLRLETFGSGWIARFDGVVFLTREQMLALAAAMPETGLQPCRTAPSSRHTGWSTTPGT